MARRRLVEKQPHLVILTSKGNWPSWHVGPWKIDGKGLEKLLGQKHRILACFFNFQGVFLHALRIEIDQQAKNNLEILD